MKKLFLNVIAAILLVAIGCSSHSFVDEQEIDGQGTDKNFTVVTFTTRMPDEGPQTRVSLEREDLDIKLKWEAGDELNVCVQYGETTETQVLSVTNISSDGKTADFSVELPEGVETFNLYGVYGGEGLDEIDPTKAKLPSAASYTSGSLEGLKASKAVMLTFAKTGIETVTPDLLVDLKHVGSLFCIQLRNASALTASNPWEGIKKVQLSAETPIGAYDNTAMLDLTTGTVSGATSGNALTFELPEAVNLRIRAEKEFWGWFVPVAGQNWPEISLKVLDALDGEMAVSANSKPARGTAAAIGKAFYFPAVYDGTALNLTQFGTLTDIDGNVYKTVVINGQEWMAENLKVTRYRNGDAITTGLSDAEWAATNTGRVGAYAVYPYTSTDGKVASEAEMIANYGLLYNGFVVQDERGLAPEGWRVATDEDFKNVERAIGMPEDILDNEAARGTSGMRLGLKLRSTTGWNNLGSDDVCFKALPAGTRRAEGTYLTFWTHAHFWTSMDLGNGTGYNRVDTNNDSVARNKPSLREGESVRCVRDI